MGRDPGIPYLRASPTPGGTRLAFKVIVGYNRVSAVNYSNTEGVSSATRRSTRSNYYSREPVQWTVERAEYVIRLKEGPTPYRNIDLTYCRDRRFRSHLKRFCIALDAYLSLCKTMTAVEIIDLCASIDGAERLELIRRKSFLRAFQAELIEPDEELIGVPHYFIRNIDEIFNYLYLIPWVVEKDSSKWRDVPLSEVRESTLSDFKDSLRAILPDDVKPADWAQIILEPSSSAVYSGGKKAPNWKVRSSQKTYFARSIGTVVGSQVQTGPGQVRDIVILDVDALNTVKLIERQVSIILNQIGVNGVGETREVLRSKYKRFQSQWEWFYCRDFKKEGLTKPRYLLKVMLEILQEKYPELPAFKYPGFFDDYAIREHGHLFIPTRGHGLGMANALTSLMQYTIVRMLNSEYACDAFITNDDIIIGYNMWDEEVVNLDTQICEDLCMILNKKKSFVSRSGGVFCEEYFSNNYNNFGQKDVFILSTLLMPLAARNVAHAKLMSRSLDYTQHPEILEEIIEYWGYEFDPREAYAPSWAGGWGASHAFGYNIVPKLLSEPSVLNMRLLRASGVPFPLTRFGDAYKKVMEFCGISINYECPDNLEGSFYLSSLSDKKSLELYDVWQRRRIKTYNEKVFFSKEDYYLRMCALGKCIYPKYLSEGFYTQPVAGRDLYTNDHVFMRAIVLGDASNYYPLRRKLLYDRDSYSVKTKRPIALSQSRSFHSNDELVETISNVGFIERDLGEYLHNPQDYIRACIAIDRTSPDYYVWYPPERDGGIQYRLAHTSGRSIPYEWAGTSMLDENFLIALHDNDIDIKLIEDDDALSYAQDLILRVRGKESEITEIDPGEELSREILEFNPQESIQEIPEGTIFDDTASSSSEEEEDLCQYSESEAPDDGWTKEGYTDQIVEEAHTEYEEWGAGAAEFYEYNLLSGEHSEEESGNEEDNTDGTYSEEEDREVNNGSDDPWGRDDAHSNDPETGSTLYGDWF